MSRYNKQPTDYTQVAAVVVIASFVLSLVAIAVVFTINPPAIY